MIIIGADYLCLVKTSCTRKINDFQRACSQVLR
jgi:hypothetical protein